MSGVAGRPCLVRHVDHVPRREELALLDVHRLAATRDSLDEVGLAAEECRSLEHVDHRRRLVQRRVLVHVGDDGDGDVVAHALEDPQPGLDAGTPEALVGGPVRLVEGGLVDEPDSTPLGNPGKRLRRLHRQRLGFDDAGSRDEKQLLLIANPEWADPHRLRRLASATRGVPAPGAAAPRDLIRSALDARRAGSDMIPSEVRSPVPSRLLAAR